MKDVLVVLMTLGFFGVCVAYVGLCDRIVGPDGPTLDEAGDGAAGDGAEPVLAAGPDTDATR
jgi:hypothetical protein